LKRGCRMRAFGEEETARGGREGMAWCARVARWSAGARSGRRGERDSEEGTMGPSGEERERGHHLRKNQNRSWCGVSHLGCSRGRAGASPCPGRRARAAAAGAAGSRCSPRTPLSPFHPRTSARCVCACAKKVGLPFSRLSRTDFRRHQDGLFRPKSSASLEVTRSFLRLTRLLLCLEHVALLRK
jgi:hypothetical protein